MKASSQILAEQNQKLLEQEENKSIFQCSLPKSGRQTPCSVMSGLSTQSGSENGSVCNGLLAIDQSRITPSPSLSSSTSSPAKSASSSSTTNTITCSLPTSSLALSGQTSTVTLSTERGTGNCKKQFEQDLFSPFNNSNSSQKITDQKLLKFQQECLERWKGNNKLTNDRDRDRELQYGTSGVFPDSEIILNNLYKYKFNFEGIKSKIGTYNIKTGKAIPSRDNDNKIIIDNKNTMSTMHRPFQQIPQWSESDIDSFELGFQQHARPISKNGRKCDDTFQQIRDHYLSHKSVSEIIFFYYFWKEDNRKMLFMNRLLKENPMPHQKVFDKYVLTSENDIDYAKSLIDEQAAKNDEVLKVLVESGFLNMDRPMTPYIDYSVVESKHKKFGKLKVPKKPRRK